MAGAVALARLASLSVVALPFVAPRGQYMLAASSLRTVVAWKVLLMAVLVASGGWTGLEVLNSCNAGTNLLYWCQGKGHNPRGSWWTFGH